MTLDSDQGQDLAVAARGNATPSGALSKIISFPCGSRAQDWQISSIARICHKTSLLYNIKHLDIRAGKMRLNSAKSTGRDDRLRPMAGVFPHVSLRSEAAHICGESGPYIAPALEGIVINMETIRKVLPELRVILFECSRKSALFEQFVAARQAIMSSSRPAV